MKVIDIARGSAFLISVNKTNILYNIEYYDSDNRGKLTTCLLSIPIEEIEDLVLYKEQKAGNLLKWIKDYVREKR